MTYAKDGEGSDDEGKEGGGRGRTLKSGGVCRSGMGATRVAIEIEPARIGNKASGL